MRLDGVGGEPADGNGHGRVGGEGEAADKTVALISLWREFPNEYTLTPDPTRSAPQGPSRPRSAP